MLKNIKKTEALIRIHNLEFEKFLPEKQVLSAIENLGNTLYTEYRDKEPLLLVVLNGAFVFASELLKSFDFPLQVEFIKYQSYEGLVSKKEVRKTLAIPPWVKDRHVLILEDIVDSGYTLYMIKKDLEILSPKSVQTAALFFKPLALTHSGPPEFAVMEIGNEFIVGFGLDYKGLGRNLRSVYRLPSV